MSEYEKLQLLKEAMAYYDDGIDTAYEFIVEQLYTDYNWMSIYTIELARDLAVAYKASFKIKSISSGLSSTSLWKVVDFIKESQEGEKNA